MGQIFGTDGVRDSAGHGWLEPARVTRLGRAVGKLLVEEGGRFESPIPAPFRHLRTVPRHRRRVLIGRDTRASGPSIERALVRGLHAWGVEALSAGVITTPGVAHLTRALGCGLGIVISASHNPAGDNGIKLFSPQGFKIPDAAEAALEALLLGGNPVPSRARKPRAARKSGVRTDDYLRFLSGFCRPLKGLSIAVDCAHGASSAYARPLFEGLGAKVILTNAAPDGRNINARCGALHPERVAAAVRRARADLGVAFDGDADRAILVDERGAIRDGDHVLALGALHLKELGKLRGNVVVSTVMANFGLERFLADRGISLRRAKVGDKFVAEEMLATGALLGGEPSGHILFLDVAPAGDGLLTALRVLDIMTARGEPLSRLAGALSKVPQVLLNVEVLRKPPLEEAGRVTAAIDAARKSLRRDGRILVRYSGTEPLCRVMVEGADAKRVERVARGLADVVRKELA